MQGPDVPLQSELFRKSIEQSWRKFDAENPIVYQTLIRLTRQAQDRGVQHLGIGLLWEVMRWEMLIAVSGDDFKLNNNYRALYARKLMRDFPEFRDMFRTRARRAP